LGPDPSAPDSAGPDPSGPDSAGADSAGPGSAGPDSAATSGADHRGSVAAVIVTYRPDLERLKAVLGAVGPQVCSLVVVDNGSPDTHEVARLVGAIPAARLVALEENHGIAAGFNAGIATALSGSPEIAWVLTLDQDSLLQGAAVSTALDRLATLQPAISSRCGVIGLRHRPVMADRGLWRLAERRLDLGDLGTFRRRLLLISSGNLVRSEVAESCRFDERLFIDQVDYDFCAEVREAGFELFELKQVLMDHRIGRDVRVGKVRRPYENGQRLYYIVRNSTELVWRRRLPPSVWLAQLATWTRSYLGLHGTRSLGRYLAIVTAGLADFALRRFGRREYRFLREPRPRSDDRRLHPGPTPD
jgi:rhamnosyltransferase